MEDILTEWQSRVSSQMFTANQSNIYIHTYSPSPFLYKNPSVTLGPNWIPTPLLLGDLPGCNRTVYISHYQLISWKDTNTIQCTYTQYKYMCHWRTMNCGSDQSKSHMIPSSGGCLFLSTLRMSSRVTPSSLNKPPWVTLGKNNNNITTHMAPQVTHTRAKDSSIADM